MRDRNGDSNADANPENQGAYCCPDCKTIPSLKLVKGTSTVDVKCSCENNGNRNVPLPEFLNKMSFYDHWPLCDICGEKNKNKFATFQCDECQKTLCTLCLLQHNQDTAHPEKQNHNITIGNKLNLKTKCENDNCPQEEKPKFLCSTCGLLYCESCADEHLQEFEGHLLKDLTEVDFFPQYDDFNSDLLDFAEDIKEEREFFEGIINKIEKAVKELKTLYDSKLKENLLLMEFLKTLSSAYDFTKDSSEEFNVKRNICCHNIKEYAIEMKNRHLLQFREKIQTIEQSLDEENRKVISKLPRNTEGIDFTGVISELQHISIGAKAAFCLINEGEKIAYSKDDKIHFYILNRDREYKKDKQNFIQAHRKIQSLEWIKGTPNLMAFEETFVFSLYDITTLQSVLHYKFEFLDEKAMFLAENGNFLLVNGITADIYNEDFEKIRRLPTKSKGKEDVALFTPNRYYVLSGNDSSRIQLVNVETMAAEGPMSESVGQRIEKLAMLRNNAGIALGMKGEIAILTVPTLDEVYSITIDGRNNKINALCPLLDGRIIYSTDVGTNGMKVIKRDMSEESVGEVKKIYYAEIMEGTDCFVTHDSKGNLIFWEY